MFKRFFRGPSDSSLARPPRWGGIEAICIGVFGTLAIHVVTAIVLSGLFPASLPRSVAIRLLASVASAGVCFMAVRAYGQSWPALGLARPKSGSWKGILAAGMSYFLVSTTIFLILNTLMPEINLNEAQRLSIDHTGGILSLAAIYLSVVLIPGLFEEIVYRGFVFGGLRARLSFWPAAVLTSFFFGLAHLQFNVGIDTFCLSLALCWLYERYHSLAPAITLHLLKNSIAFALLFLI